MKALERELNDKEPKNNLCFNATSIDQIKKNKELETFLFTKSNVKFPKLTFSMFFKKRTSSKKAERSTGHDEPMDTDFNENKDTMDMQETHTDEKDGQRQSPGQPQNVSPKCPSVPITKNESPLEDTHGFMDIQDNKDKDNMDMQETHTDEKDGQRQSPGQPQNVSPKCPSVPITKNESPLEDTHGFMDIQENEEANVQDNAEPFCAKLLQKTSPASDSDNMPSTGSWDTQEKSEAEIKAQIKDTFMPAPEETKRTVQETDGSSMEFHTTTSGAVRDPTGKSSCSNTESASATKKRGRNRENELKKKNDMNNLFSWAERQCNEEENPVDQISIINTAEHRDYPCFTAENVRVFKNPKSCESYIIFITDEKVSNYMLNYVMFVCDIKKAMILAPKEKEIEYDESFNINKCKRFIFEAFAPALAVFKKIQKEELYSIKNKNRFGV
ncbi:hypothetical protein AMELA_G00281920 [Ameiurus melas]|uniref:Uncharacterized protein n=1 Tax=Ameiurus melas TaxID=219545 RepID=A0A7J5ZKF9_AMEME|nr:hypothetical protein AMELA_G00281920 [Ameiurus melas]